MSLYSPEPDRKAINHDNVSFSDLMTLFVRMGKRAEDFDRDHSFLTANSLIGLNDEFERMFASYKANCKKEHRRVNPRRALRPGKPFIR